MDDIISPLVLKGQSLFHIFTHHRKEIKCCERTLYNYFDKNAFTARNIDLPRKVKYKPRKKSTTSVTIASGVLSTPLVPQGTILQLYVLCIIQII